MISSPVRGPLCCLHVMQSVQPRVGGPIEAVRQLVMVSSEHEQHDSLIRREIASLDRPGSPALDFPGCPVYPLSLAWYDRFLPLTLIRWLQANVHHYDLVVVECIWGFHLFATWVVLRRRRIPYVVFPHGMLDPWFKRTFPLRHLKKWLAWPWAMYPALRDARAVLFTCEQERRLARESFWLYRCKEVVVPFGSAGIPLPTHDYAKAFLSLLPALRHRRFLLFLGRVHPKKGPDLLLRALAVLQRQGLWDPAANCLVMAGPATAGYASNLQRLSDELGISDSLLWTGMLQGDEKWGAFQAAEAFVLPSHQENFGIAVVEALSASTPVLLTHSVNISPEIAADGAGLVEKDTLPGIICLLTSWLQLAEPARQAMARQARLTFERRYTVAGYASALHTLFAGIT
jgi:glycosyltransferase involved in cell wall biosynthesis